MSESPTVEDLAMKPCVSCEGARPFTLQQANASLKPLPGWKIVDGAIEKEFRFKSYLRGLDFAYALGKIAETQNHHPDIVVGWHRVTVRFSTHAIKGLSENDFIMAAKTELEYRRAV